MGDLELGLPQSLRHGLQRRRRTLRLRRRHGMGFWIAVVSPHASQPCDQRQRTGLAQRHRQVARLLSRQPTGLDRHRPRLARGRGLRLRHEVPGKVPAGALYLRLDVRHDVCHSYRARGLDLQGREARVRGTHTAAADGHDRRQGRRDLLHRGRPRRPGRTLPRQLCRPRVDRAGGCPAASFRQRAETAARSGGLS